jgi:membrane-associated protease RseP (regulator of RpoE activity)
VTRKRAAIHIALYAGCCVTTTWLLGPVFSATLMAILTCHELGHYLAARRRGLPASLPYFIPVPVYPGTMGAVISMSEPIADRNALFDVGASGPVAGLVVAIPLLAIGLAHSTIGPLKPDSAIEGNSLLYAAMKYLVLGRWLPSHGLDVQLSPMAEAAWVGVLVTMINLIPIGQLDGGHVACSLLGSKRHEVWSQRLHVALPFVGLVVAGVMFAVALRAGTTVLAALSYAKYGAIPWVLWTLMIAVIRSRAGEYHPPVGDAPLDPLRKMLAIAMLIVFVLIATPVYMRPVLP